MGGAYLHMCIMRVRHIKYVVAHAESLRLFRDTGSNHSPVPMFISLGCDSGNKPVFGAMETANIPHNDTLTV